LEKDYNSYIWGKISNAKKISLLYNFFKRRLWRLKNGVWGENILFFIEKSKCFRPSSPFSRTKRSGVRDSVKSVR
jgi:hypothetical protein